MAVTTADGGLKPVKKKPPSRGSFTCPEYEHPQLLLARHDRYSAKADRTAPSQCLGDSCIGRISWRRQLEKIPGNKIFSRKEYVERHRRLKHLGIRPFGCESCSKTFARSDLLLRHHTTCKGPTSGLTPIGSPHGDDASPAPSGAASDETDEHPVASTSGTTWFTDNKQPEPSSSTTISADLASFYSFNFPLSSTSTQHPALPTSSPNDVSPIPSLTQSDLTSSNSEHSSNSPKTPGYGFSAGSTMMARHESHDGSEQLLWGMQAKGGADLTLAPSAAETFTQDEILASEVLEDLLRSTPTHTPFYPSSTSALFSPTVGGSLAQSIDPSWHGAHAIVNEGHESSAVVSQQASTEDWSGGEITRMDQGIEFSPAAIELADYFNKGGVGGITALELGFTYEPSIFPDRMFEPQVVHADKKRFFMSSQKFCLGYLYPWHIPPIDKLSQYAELAAESFLPFVPIIHPGTIMLSEMPNHTAFALTVAGAAYEEDGEVFANEMLVEKRVYLIRSFNMEGAVEEDKFASLQSMLLYQILGLFHRDETQRLLAHTFHAALVMMLRQLELPCRVQQAYMVEPNEGLEGEVLQAVWKQWVKIETWRRVAFIVFLLDLETSTRCQAAPLLPFSELGIDLPSSDALWNADSPEDWLSRYLDPSTPKPIPFLLAIRALLSPRAPSLSPSESSILDQLAKASPLPLLILARTLSFLQMKTEEAISSHDPFRNLYTVVGLFENRDKEHREVLGRIVRGRETLKRLPGGVKRGGGEAWFENVMPTAPAQGPGRAKGTSYGQPTPSQPQPASLSAEYQMKMNADTEKFQRHIAKAEATVQAEFPTWM